MIEIDLSNKTDQEIVQACLEALALDPDPNADEFGEALYKTWNALARLLAAVGVPAEDVMAAYHSKEW